MIKRIPQGECYSCKYRQGVPGDCHISCGKPSRNVRGEEWGIENGWFFYPWNFDPTWKVNLCDNFEEDREEEEG